MPRGHVIHLRSPALLLALWAVVWAALIPPGFMPGRLAGGGLGLVLCVDGTAKPPSAPDGEAAHDAVADAALAAHLAFLEASPAESGSDDASLGSDDPPCAWAALGGAAAVRAPDAPVLVVAAAAADLLNARDVVPGRGLAAPPPPSRAPPLTA